jgi:hypothetical protein
MTFKAFFTICVISRTGTDVTAASDFRSVALPLELCDRFLLMGFPPSEFQARINCKVFERCDKSAARVSFNGRESRRCNVTRMAQVSYQILWLRKGEGRNRVKRTSVDIVASLSDNVDLWMICDRN